MANSFSISMAPELTAIEDKVDIMDLVVDAIRAVDVPAIVSEIDDNEALLNALGVIITNIHDVDLPAVNTNVSGNETKIDTAITDIGALNNISTAEVGIQVGTVLDTAIPGTPTADSINDILKDLDAKFPAGGISGLQTSRGHLTFDTNSTSSTEYVTITDFTGSGILYKITGGSSDTGFPVVKITIDGDVLNEVTMLANGDTIIINQAGSGSEKLEKASIINDEIQCLNIEFTTSLKVETKRGAGAGNAYTQVFYAEDPL